MKLLLSRSDPEKVPWLDRPVLDSLRRMAASLGDQEDVVEIVIVGDEFIRGINRDYRGVDDATDVISFSYTDGDPPCGENVAGELYVSYETVTKEAKEQSVDPKHLFLRVALHGLLHVLEYDHETDEDGRRMEAEEKRVLGQILEKKVMEALF